MITYFFGVYFHFFVRCLQLFGDMVWRVTPVRDGSLSWRPGPGIEQAHTGKERLSWR